MVNPRVAHGGKVMKGTRTLNSGPPILPLELYPPCLGIGLGPILGGRSNIVLDYEVVTVSQDAHPKLDLPQVLSSARDV